MYDNSPRHRGHNGGAERAADVRALALGTVINELRAAGFSKLSAIADGLNRKQVPTARGRGGELQRSRGCWRDLVDRSGRRVVAPVSR
jgi:hypothetical protein